MHRFTSSRVEIATGMLQDHTELLVDVVNIGDKFSDKSLQPTKLWTSPNTMLGKL